MKFFHFSLLVFIGLLLGCQADQPVTPTVQNTPQATEKKPLSIKTPEQVTKELKAKAEEKRDEFILLYQDKNEKMYIEKNRLIRNIVSPRENIISYLTLETLTSLRSFIFSEGFYDLPSSKGNAPTGKNGVMLKIQSNKRFNNVQFQGKPTAKNQPAVANILKELYRISDTFRADKK